VDISYVTWPTGRSYYVPSPVSFAKAMETVTCPRCDEGAMHFHEECVVVKVALLLDEARFVPSPELLEGAHQDYLIKQGLTCLSQGYGLSDVMNVMLLEGVKRRKALYEECVDLKLNDIRPPAVPISEAKARELFGDTFRDFQREHGKWSRKLFPDQTEQSMLSHLRNEAGCDKCGTGELHVGSDPFEIADVVMLCMAIANKRGVDLYKLCIDKFEIVKKRTWDTSGEFPAHVKEEGDKDHGGPYGRLRELIALDADKKKPQEAHVADSRALARAAVDALPGLLDKIEAQAEEIKRLKQGIPARVKENTDGA
jgi:hypothetical protein